MREPFSLLMPVYGGDRPDYLRRAFRSVVIDQTEPPDQIVIVRDGPVREELTACLGALIAASPVPVTFVPLERNGGLGPALDRGLAACWFDVVARMDADDIAVPHRFEVELDLIARADIAGSGLLEFVGDTDEIVGQRVPPVEPDQIRKYARVADPFNHPTVIYRREAVLAAGGYGDLPLMEDYSLFVRMLQRGARPLNSPEPLVFYRVGEAAFRRRGGRRLLASEFALQREFLRNGFVTPAGYLRNVAVRGGYRLVPWWLRRAVYRPIVARYTDYLDSSAAQYEPPVPPVWEPDQEWYAYSPDISAELRAEPLVPGPVVPAPAAPAPVAA
jgi:glycosyltransferase involved in cell wall biosynthesis